MTRSFLYLAANHPTYENYLTWGPPIWLWVGLELISNHFERSILSLVDEGPRPIQSLKAFFLHYVPNGCSLPIHPPRTSLDHCLVNGHCPSPLEMKWTNKVIINNIYVVVFYHIDVYNYIIYVVVFYHIDVYNYCYICCCILSYWHLQLLLSTPHKSNNIKSP
jgi:hypothetical protein